MVLYPQHHQFNAASITTNERLSLFKYRIYAYNIIIIIKQFDPIYHYKRSGLCDFKRTGWEFEFVYLFYL